MRDYQQSCENMTQVNNIQTKHQYCILCITLIVSTVTWQPNHKLLSRSTYEL